MIKRIFIVIFLCLFGAGSVFAGGAVTQRQQMQQQMQQQMIARQQAAIKQVVEQRAAQQAAMVAQRQAQQVASQVAVAQQQAMQQAAQQMVIHRQIVPRGSLEVQGIDAGLLQKKVEEASQVAQVATLDDVVNSLDVSGETWSLLIDPEAKAAVVSQYIVRYRQKGIVIQKAPALYAQMIDSMSEQSPEMLSRPFPQVLETVAVIEYDFNNGYNKDVLARKILGSDQAVAANKQRLGIR